VGVIRTTAISLALHAVVGIVFAATRETPRPAPPGEAVTLEIIELTPSPPRLAVSTTTPAPSAGTMPAGEQPVASAKTTRAPARSRGRTAIAPQPADSGGTVETTGTQRGRDWMKMGRGGDAPKLGVGRPRPWSVDGISRHDPIAPIVEKPQSPMRPVGGGRYQKNHAAYKAHVARDGRVTFKDKPNLAFDGFHLAGGVLPVLRFRFDLTDWAIRMAGNDPYAYDKMKFLRETFDERMEMAAEARTELLQEAIRDLPDLLAAVWSQTKRTAAERRRLLFELWDACVEPGAKGVDEELGLAGAQARVMVIAFVRRELPAGSADAYTAEELETLNKDRDSREPFVPYDLTRR
jgi:hypothetical protein